MLNSIIKIMDINNVTAHIPVATTVQHSLFVSDCPLTTYVFAPTDAWTVGRREQKVVQPRFHERTHGGPK